MGFPRKLLSSPAMLGPPGFFYLFPALKLGGPVVKALAFLRGVVFGLFAWELVLSRYVSYASM